jgi:hypothetical protein
MRHGGREVLSAGPAQTGRLRQGGLYFIVMMNIGRHKFA